MASTSDARRAAAGAAREVVAGAAAEIHIDPAEVARYAESLGMLATRFGLVAPRVDEALGSIPYLVPDIHPDLAAVKAALLDCQQRFNNASMRTVRLAQVFVRIEATMLGSGVPAYVWEHELQELEALKTTKPGDGLLGVLDHLNSFRAADLAAGFGIVGEFTSFDDATALGTLLKAPVDVVTLSDQMSVVAINKVLDKELSGLTDRAARRRAQRAVVKLVGKGVLGPGVMGGETVEAIVHEFVGGDFKSVDELVARVDARLAPDGLGARANHLRVTILQTAPRLIGQRSTRLLDQTLRSPQVRRALAAVNSIEFGGLRPAAAAKVDAVRNTKVVSGLMRGAAKLALPANMALTVLDVRGLFTDASKLGRTSQVLGIISGTSAALAVFTSWTGVGFVGFGTVAWLTGAAAAGTSVADTVNQYQNDKAYQRAFDAAYEKALVKEVDRVAAEKANRELAAIRKAYNVTVARPATRATTVPGPLSVPSARATAAERVEAIPVWRPFGAAA